MYSDDKIQIILNNTKVLKNALNAMKMVGQEQRIECFDLLNLGAKIYYQSEPHRAFICSLYSLYILSNAQDINEKDKISMDDKVTQVLTNLIKASLNIISVCQFKSLDQINPESDKCKTFLIHMLNLIKDKYLDR